MPLREEEDIAALLSAGLDTSRARKLLERVVHPALPRHIPQEQLVERMKQPKTVVLTCGNPSVMEDIQHIADVNGLRFEKEEW